MTHSENAPIRVAPVKGNIMATNLTRAPRLGDKQVNATDYDGQIVIEQYDFHGIAHPSWAVPAWEERGLSNLAGPFETVEQAKAALEAEER